MGYITACDTDTQVVVIFIDGGYQLAFISAIGHIEFMVAFHDTPAVVAAFYDDVYFFIFVLAYITRKKLFGALVKRDAPGVAQAIGPYVRAYAVAANKGIVFRHRVWIAVYVYPYDLTQQGVEVLSITDSAVLISTAATIAQGNVEVAVRAEHHVAAIVVGLWLLYLHHYSFRGRICQVGISGGNSEFGNSAFMIAAFCIRRHAVVHIKFPVLFELRMKGDAQQAAFIVGGVDLYHFSAYIQEGLGYQFSMLNDPYFSFFLADELAVAAVSWHAQCYRGEYVIGDQLQTGFTGWWFFYKRG